MKLDIYCDESRLEFLESADDGFMVIGSLWLEREKRDTLKSAIKALKKKHHYTVEIKWVLKNPNAQLYKGYNHKTKRYDANRRLALCVDDYVVVVEFTKVRTKAKFITAYVADGINGKGEKAIDLIKGGESW